MIRAIFASVFILWLLSAAVPLSHPLVILAQATAWVAAVLLVLVVLPGWRSRVIAIFVVLVLVELPHLRTPPPSPDGAVRVVSINTQYQRTDTDQLASEIAALGPDLVILAETTEEEAAAVATATGLAVTGPPIKSSGRGVAILVGDGATVRPELKAGIHQLPVVDKQGVTVVGVHTVAPVNARQAALWTQDFEELRRVAEGDGPMIMAGDFNASSLNPPMRSLGLVNCSPLTPTWPSFAAVLRIDHILVRGGACGAAGAFRVAGTDHVGVWADISPDA